MKDNDFIDIDDGMAGLVRSLKERGQTLDDIDVDSITVHHADSFVARRLRMEDARRKKERT